MLVRFEFFGCIRQKLRFVALYILKLTRRQKLEKKTRKKHLFEISEGDCNMCVRGKLIATLFLEKVKTIVVSGMFPRTISQQVCTNIVEFVFLLIYGF